MSAADLLVERGTFGLIHPVGHPQPGTRQANEPQLRSSRRDNTDQSRSVRARITRGITSASSCSRWGSGTPLTSTSGPRDLLQRQQTLRSDVVWSHDLLYDLERRLFARLGVFAAGFPLEAAEIVCADDAAPAVLDGIASLVDKSLVRTEDPCTDSRASPCCRSSATSR
jgi:hypothetical protein